MREQINRRGSILRQLLVVLLAGAALLAVILFLLVQSFALRLSEESQDNILAASVTSILDAVSVQEGELVLDLPYSAFSMLGNLSDDRVFYAIRENGTFLTGYEDLPEVSNPSPEEARFITAQYQNEEVRVVSAARQLFVDGRLVMLSASVGQTRQAQAITLKRISRNAGALGIGFFLSTALLAYFAGRAAIAPLERLTASVTRRGPQDLRPVAAPVPREMAPLVSALNGFMERLKTSLARSEDFIAEAAHRVRTPLATVRTQAETTLMRVDRDENRTSLREMIRAIDESSRAAGQLLDHAMVSFRADHLEAEEIDLSQLAADMVHRLGPLADLRDISMFLDAPDPVRSTGDPILIQNALRNLLDNAIKYSQAEGEVAVSVRAKNGLACVEVRDQGIGFPEKGAEALTGRFIRGSNVETVVGSGLGLTIADEVVGAHGGSLSIHNNSEGPGACVTMFFPLL
ncbi:sensor histidine kinase N-terminal domain-containing protein [Primorskyibacter sp. S87]|uniref:sensor histidine kinase N-terminal domain-containing protein n=1 Tax=Primorskyibacter sp. S87 TaxID=3415126 RepID=UPI003C79DD60